MTMKLKWGDAEEIAIALYEKYPDQDPMEVRYTDLRDWVRELEDFDEKDETCTERKLEAIQMAWLEEYQE
jgi:FeS assembly protein IscX